jgi:hypothetical protein
MSRLAHFLHLAAQVAALGGDEQLEHAWAATLEESAMDLPAEFAGMVRASFRMGYDTALRDVVAMLGRMGDA